jgi:hypothetical protein
LVGTAHERSYVRERSATAFAHPTVHHLLQIVNVSCVEG